MAFELLTFVGIALIFIGMFIIALAALLASRHGVGKGNVKAGGVVIIGPVPIVFGSDKKMVKTMLILAIVLTVLVLAVTVVNYLLSG